MKTRTLLYLTATLLLALAGCAAPLDQPASTAPADGSLAPAATEPPPAPSPTPTEAPSTPAEVVLAAAQHLSAGDLEGGMAYWADDAIWYIFGLPPNGSELMRGKEAIRAEFENEIAGHLNWEIDPLSVVGNVVTSHDKTWLDFTRQIGVAPVEATGQYLVEDGKISTYAWTIDPESLVKLKAALAEMPAEPEAEQEPAPPQTPVSEVAITIAGGTCSYDGPLALQAGEIQVTVDAQDQDKEAYAVTFMTADPGKNYADLMATTTGTPPSWVQLLHYEEVGPGATATWSIAVAEGPLYAICWASPPDHPIGNVGPFEVVAQAEPAPAIDAADMPPSGIVVTYADGKCKLNSPLELQAGEVTVSMVVNDSRSSNYAFTAFHLEPGKTLRELVQSQSGPAPPSWADMISMHEASPGQVNTFTMELRPEPLYILCWAAEPDRVITSIGPLEVGQ